MFIVVMWELADGRFLNFFAEDEEEEEEDEQAEESLTTR